jgi:cell shape-determining protein MreC
MPWIVTRYAAGCVAGVAKMTGPSSLFIGFSTIRLCIGNPLPLLDRLYIGETMNTDSFIWALREKDRLREEIRELKRELAEKEARLAELTAAIDKETAPRASA